MNYGQSSFNLNEKQLEAVQTVHGALLISAGAGSGKTQVLTSRIAHIISKKLAQPDQILAVTFTNKAAKEMTERVTSMLSDLPLFEPLWISTFHSACARILRENIKALAPRKQVIIYDSGDQLSLIKKVMKDLSIDENYHPAKSFQKQISLCKRMALSPYEVNNHPRLRLTEDFPHLYEAYEEALLSAEAFDFEGLLFEVYKLFTTNSEILSHYQEKFKFISIDEYQDTNHLQYLLVKQLAQKHKNICVVGDEDQSIYSWRGADISNILNFEKDFPDCKIIKLEQNYRSTQTIISAAGSLIRHNHSRINKTLFTNNSEGDLIEVRSHWDDKTEANSVVQTILNLCEKGDMSYNDFSVFYRTNAQSRILEDQFRKRNIPYQIVGNLKFYDRAEIKDMISYLRLILNPRDEISLRRAINSPKRGIGKTTIEKASSLSTNQTLYESLVQYAETYPNKKPSKSIMEFHHTLTNLRESAQKKQVALSQLYLNLLHSTNYLRMLELEQTPEANSRIENLTELGNAIQQFEEEMGDKASLETFLEQMSLLSSAHMPHEDAVQMMTLHLSKGLEFDVVFITGLEEGLFPLIQNIDDIDIEEERRLAYVGMTRAKKKLFLSYAQNRKRFGIDKKQIPSRFLKEISQDYLLKPRKFPNLSHSF
ncbi:MAG: UvrD-helicase domain-containing protein [Bdellovibrionales bacterium]|nr:UvrD-helicase domain-containing protein [Bdellovibrionales bacterium]